MILIVVDSLIAVPRASGDDPEDCRQERNPADRRLQEFRSFGKSPAWAPARAGRLLTGAGKGVRPCRDRLPGETAACAQSRQLPGRGDIPHQAGAEPPGVRFRPPPESAREAALTLRSRAIGRGNGAEGRENRRFGGRRARNRDRIGGSEPGTGNNLQPTKPADPQDSCC